MTNKSELVATPEEREMIEKAARAIYYVDPAIRVLPRDNRTVEWEDAPEVVKQRCREQAKAALVILPPLSPR